MANLVQQGEASATDTTCTASMSGLTAGNMLVAAVVYRDTTQATFTDGWQIVGAGTPYADGGTDAQNCLILCKKVTGSSATLKVTQSSSARFYIVWGEFSDVTSVNWLGENLGLTEYTVGFNKGSAGSVLYAVNSVYFGSGRTQTATPDDLTKLQGDSSQERLAAWFDDGTGAQSHVFAALSSTEERKAQVCAVALLPYESKYLIGSGANLYTVQNGALVEVQSSGMTAVDVFQQYGLDAIPDTALMLTLANPSLLFWQDSDDALPALSATLTGHPTQQQTIISDELRLDDATTLGIESVSLDASGSPLFAVSFDGGAFKVFSGGVWINSDSGMTAEELLAVTVDQWNAAIAGVSYIKVRAILTSENDVVTNVTFKLKN